jgi:hypothetical protein
MINNLKKIMQQDNIKLKTVFCQLFRYFKIRKTEKKQKVIFKQAREKGTNKQAN